MRRSFPYLGLIALILVVGNSPARAGRFFYHKRGTPPPGEPRCLPHTAERAGYPRCLAGHVEPTLTDAECGHYIGGGGGHGSGSRRREEGTWGWDYVGTHLPRRVFLGWNHGRYQGGTGSYTTDTPCPVPDLIAGGVTTIRGGLSHRD